jgi:hypothetical protein
MSVNENDQNAVLRAQHDPDGRMARENADLRAQLAAMQGSNVLRGGFSGEAPRYSLNEPGFYDDTYFVAGSTIEFLDTPNLSMVPLNDPAHRAMAAYIDHLENGARRAAVMKGRDFFGLVTDRNVLIDQLRADTTAEANAPVPVIQVPQAHGTVPAMPHTEDARAAALRGPGRPRKVVQSVAPSPMAGPAQNTPMAAPARDTAGPAIVGRMVR